jgi:uncharacterized protein YprB with RNaseH-like and TPR domain
VENKKNRVLLLDIETAPNIAYVWGLWDQNISPSQIKAAGYILCFTAKWLGEDKSVFASVKGGVKRMLRKMHNLLNQADAVVHYNGKRFDIPTLNKEFVQYGFDPPRNYVQIDLLLAVRAAFKFPSHKMDYVCQTLGLGKKVRHPGQEMWTACMESNHSKHEQAWRNMERYNKGDIRIMERLYRRIRPWFVTVHGFKRISEQLDGKRKWR